MFLITYKVAEINLDNTLSILAGLAALLVALCPTARPGPAVGQTPLQQRLGETFVSTIHFTAAATFISALALLSFYFGKREGARPRRGETVAALLADLPLVLRGDRRGRARVERDHRAHGLGPEPVAALRRGGRGLGVRHLVAVEGPRARPAAHGPLSRRGSCCA